MKFCTIGCSSEASITRRRAGRAECSIPPDRRWTVRIRIIHTKEEEHGLLGRIKSLSDLQAFTPTELVDPSRKIREFLVSPISKTGGHLGPNLGVVELTIALHRALEFPKDTFAFNTGHQSYVHKILAGRKDFTRLHEASGLSGYLSRKESVHDVLESSHASSSITWVDGISVRRWRQGEDFQTIAVIGDGALAGGMAQEGLNRLAASKGRRVLIIVSGNGRSYASTIGGLTPHLDALRVSEGYEHALSWGKHQLLPLGESG